MNAVSADTDVTLQDDRFVDLLASSVHDIKNSIGLLLDAADTVSDTLPETSDARASVCTLQHEARRINYDLMHLLGLFKFERTRATVRFAVVDCHELLEELMAFNAALLAQRGITLVTECRLANEGYFDRELVLGVLNSVVNNAFRHARSRVAVTCDVRDGYTVFSIIDDGAGYAPRLLGAAPAEPGGTTYRHGNTGLGLYFARRIAAMHEHRGRHGRVALRNDPESGGGCFELWLP
ncbi:MAG: sensor histidine kinase [Acetobacteraceae bacterium]